MSKVLVLFYSTYGHCYGMAKAAVEGATDGGATAVLKRVPETLPDEVLTKMGALEAQKAFADVPVATPDELPEYDAVIYVTPTRFGGIPAQMKSFMDACGGLWMGDKLVGKVGSVITSTATQHGGQETTLRAVHVFMMHMGNIVVGLPYSFKGQSGVEEVKGGSPYGATTIANGDGSRMPTEPELAGARFQGKHVATIANKLTSPNKK